MARPDALPADASAVAAFSIGSVVTAYRPGPELVDSIRVLAGQVDRVVIVDDGSGPDADEVLTAAEALGARVLRLPRNSGIAAALNAGVAELLHEEVQGPVPDGILFFDQDSAAGPGFVRSLVTAFLAASRDSVPVAGSVPEFFGATAQTGGTRGGHAQARSPIQSGLLVATDALRELGPFRDEYFIDLVDTEFAMRAEVHGFVFVAARGIRLPHALGRQVGLPALHGPFRGPAGRVLGFTVSAPFRYYYRARNRVALDREYRWRRPFSLAWANLLELRHYAIVWLAVRQRGAFVALLRAGRRDARAGRMGRIPPGIEAGAARLTWRHPL